MTFKRLIASLESAPIGDGDLLGEPFKVLPYQRRFLRGAFKGNYPFVYQRPLTSNQLFGTILM